METILSNELETQVQQLRAQRTLKRSYVRHRQTVNGNYYTITYVFKLKRNKANVNLCLLSTFKLS